MEIQILSTSYTKEQTSIGRSSTSSQIIQLPVNGELPEILFEYLRLTTGKEIQRAIEPLKKFNISYFLYSKKFKDGTYINLTNFADWQTYFYKNHLYLKSAFEDPGKSIKSGKYLWSTLPGQEIYKEIRERFNIVQGITIVKNFKDCDEFYHFGSTVGNPTIINFYLNNCDILQRFILYFKDNAAEVIKKASHYRISLPTRKEISNNLNLLNNSSPDSAREFMQQTKIKRYYLIEENSELYLTQAEIRCLGWYIEGKSSAEIAMILGISKRTVETHLENIKKKTNCYNKARLSYCFSPLMKKFNDLFNVN